MSFLASALSKLPEDAFEALPIVRNADIWGQIAIDHNLSSLEISALQNEISRRQSKFFSHSSSFHFCSNFVCHHHSVPLYTLLLVRCGSRCVILNKIVNIHRYP